ncbi:MAG: class II glutamine amidotransferase, partial [Acidaminococcaceae bacterium]|nr:class II glutamine amidotransferase [Acidaminococcaceae bacterium]
MDKVKEECGVFGILDPEGGSVAHSIYYGLTALQHRGQEACGIVTSDTSGPVGNYHCRKNAGLVSEVFHENSLESLPGNLGIGHVRYSTTGGSRPENAQPLAISYIKGTLALAHNGNLVNTADLKCELVRNGAVFHTTTDSEVIAFYLARERVHTQTIQEAVLATARKLSGSYALVIMSPQKLIGLRDPYGLKPLCLGKRGQAYILASESCALSAVDAEFIRDVEPGEMVTLSEKGIESDRSLQTGRCAHCIFEYIYFA